MLYIICAYNNNRSIGANNRLLYKIKKDLTRFKEMTIGGIVIMGRKTYESIGRPLPNRQSWVLTRDPNFIVNNKNVRVFNTVDDIIFQIEKYKLDCFVIGGESIYDLFIEHADILYLTVIDDEQIGDTFFPEFEISEWEIFNEEKHKEGSINFKFIDYKRN